MKYLFLITFLGVTTLTFAQDTQPGEILKYPSTLIYGTDEYSAFTDLIHFQGAFYCSFRVGTGHVGGEDGKVRILRSSDGQNWKSIALLEKEGVDLRDPKLSVTPDGRIMVIIGGSIYDGKTLLDRIPHVSFSNKRGKKFGEPIAVDVMDNTDEMNSWIWRVIWNDGVGYGMDYQTHQEDHWDLYLTKTNDGKSFEKVSKLEVDGLPNEATIRFTKDNEMYVLIRREGKDRMGLIGKSHAPYTDWNYTKLNFQLGGPNFLFLNDSKLVIGTRNYVGDRKTYLYVTDLNGEVEKTIELPSGGDTSYPGLLIHDDFLWVSYYSSHEGNSHIYLSKIPMKDLL